MCGCLVAVAGALRRRCTREGLHGYNYETPVRVCAVDGILGAKALPAFMLAAMATTSEGVVLLVEGAI